jgi:hypothetical protein
MDGEEVIWAGSAQAEYIEACALLDPSIDATFVSFDTELLRDVPAPTNKWQQLWPAVRRTVRKAIFLLSGSVFVNLCADGYISALRGPAEPAAKDAVRVCSLHARYSRFRPGQLRAHTAQEAPPCDIGGEIEVYAPLGSGLQLTLGSLTLLIGITVSSTRHARWGLPFARATRSVDWVAWLLLGGAQIPCCRLEHRRVNAAPQRMVDTQFHRFRRGPISLPHTRRPFLLHPSSESIGRVSVRTSLRTTPFQEHTQSHPPAFPRLLRHVQGRCGSSEYVRTHECRRPRSQ